MGHRILQVLREVLMLVYTHGFRRHSLILSLLIAASGCTGEKALISNVTDPTVFPPAQVARVTIQPADTTLTVGDNYVQFSATAIDQWGATIDTLRFVWTAEPQSILAATDSGLVGAIAPGVGEVTVTAGDSVGRATVRAVAPVLGTPVFQDGFESGARSGPQNGYGWGSVTTATVSVSSDRAFSGTYSLKFSFGLPPDPPGQDSWAEARLGFGEYLPAVWVEYMLYVPSNFVHRTDPPSNNKFFMAWRDTYGSGGDWRAGYEYEDNGSGDSRLRMMSNRYANSVMTSNGLNPQLGQSAPLVTNTGPLARGAWTWIRAEFRAATAAGANDGVMRLWAGNVLIGEKTDGDFWNSVGDPETLLHNCYILGWSNSGFAALTEFFVDDLKIYSRNPGWSL
jgi:hypothetical protein